MSSPFNDGRVGECCIILSIGETIVESFKALGDDALASLFRKRRDMLCW